MGCGTLCGEISIANHVISPHIKITLDKQISQIEKNRQLVGKQPYLSFLQKYQESPFLFFINIKKKPNKNEGIQNYILIKWKVIIFGVDKQDKDYCDCVGLNNEENIINARNFKSDISTQTKLIHHENFDQIEKDIGRTFAVYEDYIASQTKVNQFKNILKRITNHFPKMGYTQGINFIVSYLLILGYSEKESFQLFVHLAINRKFLLLGMYEDEFPLNSAIMQLFKNSLKRINPRLYYHIFEFLKFDINAWIYQWFMTLFVSLFPQQILKYVWDFIIMVGNYGMAIVAISLLEILEPIILQFSDFIDLSQLFKSLKTFDTFNQYIDVRSLMIKIYNIDLVQSDFQNDDQKNNYCVFIREYFQQSYYKNSPKREDQNLVSNDILRQWRKNIIRQRIQFKQINEKVPDNFLQIRLQTKSDHENQDLQVVILQNQIPSTQINSKLQRAFTAKSQNKIMPKRKVEYLFNQINQKFSQEDQSIVSNSSRNKRRKESHKIIQIDELDKLQYQINQRKNSSIAYNQNYIHQNEKPIEVRVNNYSGVNQSNTLGMVGQLTIRNTMTYDAISISSKRNSNKSHSKTNNNKNNKINSQTNSRICGCKTKTQQNKCLSIDRNSELAESKYQFSDKDSVSINNYSHNDQIQDANSARNAESSRQRVFTHADYLVNSHCGTLGKKRSDMQIGPKVESDIEVIVPQFKKNKRTRVNVVTPLQPAKRQKIIVNWEHEQQSIQSINPIDRFSQGQSQCSHSINRCQIESIK